jgi:hypothetical protein
MEVKKIKRKVLPEWRTSIRRGAFAAIVLGLTLGDTWVSGTKDWGWPLLPSLVIVLGGIYALFVSKYAWLPWLVLPEKVPVDNSTKYFLYIDNPSGYIFNVNSDDPTKFDFTMRTPLRNDGRHVIQVSVDQIDIEVEGVDSVSHGRDVGYYRLLPDRARISWPSPVRGVPPGFITATIRYAIRYGAPGADDDEYIPVYLRTYAMRVWSKTEITSDIIANQQWSGIEFDSRTWEREKDIDLRSFD